MKSTLSLLFSLIAITTSLAEQMSFSLGPQIPFSNDGVLLTISQHFNWSCNTTKASFDRIGAPIWGSSSGTHSFDVTASPILKLLMTEPVGLRFESIAGFGYQVQWSTTLESWFDLGEVIIGTGADITVYDPMEPGPRRYYQVKVDPQPDGPETPPQLEITVEGATLTCQLTGHPDYSTGYWILQVSADLNNWEDQLFFDEDGEAVVAIPPGGQARQFLRARYIKTDDPIWRDFLDARNTWRSAGIDRYSFRVSGQGLLPWSAVVTVHNDEIISVNPGLGSPHQPPAQRTIEGWFAYLARFLDPRYRRPDQIDVLYDPVYGFMSSASIDIDRLILHEGVDWTIQAFQPLP